MHSPTSSSALLLPNTSSALIPVARSTCNVLGHMATLNKLPPMCARDNQTAMTSHRRLLMRQILTLVAVEEEEEPGSSRRLADESRAHTLLRDLSRPTASCAGKLVRRGAQGDGGYVLCSLLLPSVGRSPSPSSSSSSSSSSSACLIYSFGIKDQYDFENEAAARGCTVHGYDPTVPWRTSMRFHFHRLGLGDAPRFMPGVGPVSTLSKAMADNGHTGRRLTLFKCDVEGAEWGALGSMSDAQLASLSHVIIEVHLTGEAGRPRESDAQWMERFAPTIARLRQHMDLYRAHANNCGGFRQVGGVIIPLVWELSFARKGTLPPLPEQAPSHANAENDPLDKPVCGTTAFTRRWVTADLECECKSGDAASCSCKQRFIPFKSPSPSPSQQQHPTHGRSATGPAPRHRRESSSPRPWSWPWSGGRA
jgi:hypothetical protein